MLRKCLYTDKSVETLFLLQRFKLFTPNLNHIHRKYKNMQNRAKYKDTILLHPQYNM